MVNFSNLKSGKLFPSDYSESWTFVGFSLPLKLDFFLYKKGLLLGRLTT